MAQESDRKEEIKFRVHLKGNKYIIGNGECYWIVREDMLTKQSGENKGDKYVRRAVLSGYHREFEDLFDSYLGNTVRNSGIDGELADLVKLIKKTKAEIRSWVKKMDKVWEGDD